MKKFFTLLKIDLINGFALNKNFGKNKKNRSKKSSNLALAILLVFLMLISTSSYAFMIGNVARVANMPEVLLAYGIGAGVIAVLMMTFANAYGTLFKSRDFELLASLPIDSRIIVASKIVSLTFIGYAYYTLVYLPAFVMYIIIAGVNVVFLVSSFIVWLFAPLLVTTLCSFIAYVFGRISSRFKNKNTISTILYAIFIIALVVGIYAINFTIPRDESNVDAMAVYAEKMYCLRGALCALRIHGLWPECTEPLGALRIPHRRFLLRSGWLLRHEDGHLRLCPYCQRSSPEHGRRSEDRFPLRCRHGSDGCRTGTA